MNGILNYHSSKLPKLPIQQKITFFRNISAPEHQIKFYKKWVVGSNAMYVYAIFLAILRLSDAIIFYSKVENKKCLKKAYSIHFEIIYEVNLVCCTILCNPFCFFIDTWFCNQFKCKLSLM